jgi:glycosyltransferase involved in cell wall biosynthesis
MNMPTCSTTNCENPGKSLSWIGGLFAGFVNGSFFSRRARDKERNDQLRENQEKIAALERELRTLENILRDSLQYGGPVESTGQVRVSVIMPTRNRVKYIGEAIASVKAQHFPDWELIIINDGSEDETKLQLARFLDDSRIRYFEIPHSGGGKARNTGLGHARGEFIAYLDDDNVWYPGFLSAAVAQLDARPEDDLVYGVLVSEHHQQSSPFFSFAFDRDQLYAGNFIDINVIVHRRTLFEKYGGFAGNLTRLEDWDVILKYSQASDPRRLFALACKYRKLDNNRITDTQPFAPNLVAIRRKHSSRKNPAIRLRVLYVLWHYPQLSETYIEAELRQMLRWGAEIEVWREAPPATPYESDIVVHDGHLQDAINKVRPDVIHVHWLSYAQQQKKTLANAGIPVTIRLHGFDSYPEHIAAMLANSWLRMIYGFPMHVQQIPPNPRLKAIPTAFQSELFRPTRKKNRRLVVRAGAGLQSKDIPFFFELAKRLPDFRFVLCLVTCNLNEHYIAELKELATSSGSPGEIRIDVPRIEMATLMSEAGIYLHTMNLPGSAHSTPVGMPISVAEAMATGAYVLVREIAELVDYVGDAGDGYVDIDHAVQLISATQHWTDEMWDKVFLRSVERAFGNHADEIALRPMFEDWVDLVLEKHRQAAGGGDI